MNLSSHSGADQPVEETEKVRQGEETTWPLVTPYSIHVNSYSKRENAEKRIKQLLEMDYNSFLVPADIPGKGRYYRVFIGQFNDIEDARDILNIYRTKKEFRKDIHIMDRKHAFGG